MKMQLVARAAIATATLTMAGMTQAAGGSFVCKDNFATLKEIKAEVAGSSTFVSIVNQYVARWDAQEARRLCAAYAAGEPVTISCLNGRRDWSAIKASIPADYFGLSNQQLASSYTAEMQRGNGFKEALAYCRDVGATR